MQEINEQKARSLIVSGVAGYWGIHHRTVVVEHDEQTVVRLCGRWFLATAEELSVKFVGYAGVIGGRTKGAFAIECKSKEIEELARKEMLHRSVTLDLDGHKIVNVPSDVTRLDPSRN